jgi:DAK2 domain fusion protein YloV
MGLKSCRACVPGPGSREGRNRKRIADGGRAGQNAGADRPDTSRHDGPAGYSAGVRETYGADDARRWALLTRAAFAARRREIDDLNVYPVPDGDTGTNLYLTLDGALDQVAEAHTSLGILGRATLVEESEHLGRAILLSARGNSGVILSEIMRGLTRSVVEGGHDHLDARQLATAFARGAAQARRAVAHPQEGTMLTVADAAAAAAVTEADRGASLVEVVAAAQDAAAKALRRTPEQLPALAAAGVVDAGGVGVVLMLEALSRALTGDWSAHEDAVVGAESFARREEWRRPDLSAPGSTDTGVVEQLSADHGHASAPHSVELSGPAYEVMYVLEDSDEQRAEVLVATLDALGDSLIVSGGPDLWTVHVHVDDVGAAIEAGIEAGRPRRIVVTNFAHQIAGRQEPNAIAGGTATEAPNDSVGVVACAAGPGIAALLTDAGAVVVDSAPGARASAGQLLEAARATGAHIVLLLPNDKDTMLAAQAAVTAAADQGITAHLIPARTAVQGLAAMAVHDPSHSAQDNVLAMTGAVRATRHGAVTVAAKEGLTSGGHCVPGDVLGIIDGDIVIVGGDLTAVAREVLQRLLGAGGELVTLLTGADAPADVIAELERQVHDEAPHVELVVLEGGQAAYPFLIGVE